MLIKVMSVKKNNNEIINKYSNWKIVCFFCKKIKILFISFIVINGFMNNIYNKYIIKKIIDIKIMLNRINGNVFFFCVVKYI